jgi:hypothetical protein
VFVGPFEIAGYYGQLAAALCRIGVDAVAVDLGEHRFQYDGHKPASVWIAAARWAERRFRAARDGPAAVKTAWRALQVLTRIGLVGWSIWRFDAFIFGFGNTLLFGRELPLLRLFRKRLVFTFNGSDARPPYIDGADMAASRATTVDECIGLARGRKAHIRRIERYAHAIVSLPTFSHFFERPVIDYVRVGAPWTPANARGDRDDGAEIRILHSPSDPEVKGSDRIRAAVDRMRAAGRPLRLVELREVPNETVRAEIARADFVIDQLYSDTPMAVFATEAAAAGVPAIVGSYAWPELRGLYPNAAMPPVEQCHPDGLAAAIERLADDPEYRLALGARARAFVETEWAPERIAERYLTILRGEAPGAWLFDPRGVRYLHGVGLPETRTRELIGAVLEHAGRDALQLADKPALEQAFVEFAGAR